MKDAIEYKAAKLCDDVLEGKDTKVESNERRVWLKNFVALTAGGAVLWACGEDDSKSNDNVACSTEYTVEDKKADAGVLNVALALEHEAISIYTSAASLSVWGTDASALAPTFLEVAKSFLAHHEAHKAAIIAEIDKIKGETGIEAVTASAAGDYLTPYPGIASLSGASGLLTVLQVAAEREMNAANAYHSVIPAFKNRDLIQTLGGLSSDEAAHYGVLNAAALAHEALSSASGSALTATNVVSGALPPFTYPKTVRS